MKTKSATLAALKAGIFLFATPLSGNAQSPTPSPLTPSAPTAGVRPASGNAKTEDGVIEAKIDKILGALLNSQFGPSGFMVAPIQINYEESTEYKEIEQGSTWKLANKRLGVLYAAKQKPLNDRLRPNAKACRADLIKAFNCAAELYGGSVQGTKVKLAEAQTEWIIANLDKREAQVTTDDEIKEVFPTADELGMPEELYAKKINAVFKSLGRAEKHLTKNQANVLRREFIAYLR